MSKRTAEELQQIAKVYASGVTLANLAEQFGVSIPTMSKYVVKGGGIVRSRGNKMKATPVVEVSEPLTSTVETFEPRTSEPFVSRTILAME